MDVTSAPAHPLGHNGILVSSKRTGAAKDGAAFGDAWLPWLIFLSWAPDPDAALRLALYGALLTDSCVIHARFRAHTHTHTHT